MKKSTTPTSRPTTNNLGRMFEKYSANVWGPILSGIVGLALSVILLLGWPWDGKNRFHEIDLHFRDANTKSLTLLKSSLDAAIKKTDSFYKKALEQKLKDTETIKKRLDTLNKQRYKLTIREFDQSYRRTDTFLLDAKRLAINPDKLESVITDKKLVNSLSVGYNDPEYAPDTYSFNNAVSSRPYFYSMTFFRKYPFFAFWLFLGILQMVMWLLMVPISISAYNNIRDLHAKAQTINRRGKSFLYAGLAMGIFCLLLYTGIIDDYVFQDNHFMRDFNTRIIIYSMLGYLVSLLCLAGYLYLADTLNQLQKPFNQKAADLVKKRVEMTVAAANDPVKLAAIDTDPQIVQLTADKNNLEEQYKQAKTFFNLFLGMAAMVLSVLILWIASMFHAINSLEIFRYYKAISGYNYVSNDFIYLFGGLHSILLGIFVLPVKFRIMEMNTHFPNLPETVGKSNTTLSSILKNIGATLREVLVISSPLLASFLQNVIQSLFN